MNKLSDLSIQVLTLTLPEGLILTAGKYQKIACQNLNLRDKEKVFQLEIISQVIMISWSAACVKYARSPLLNQHLYALSKVCFFSMLSLDSIYWLVVCCNWKTKTYSNEMFMEWNSLLDKKKSTRIQNSLAAMDVKFSHMQFQLFFFLTTITYIAYACLYAYMF